MEAIKTYGVTPHAGDPVDRLRVTREVDPSVVLLGYDQHVFVEKLEQYRDAVKPAMQIKRARLFHRELFSSSKFRKVIEDAAACFVLIDKPSGEPSLHTVTKLRRATGIRQIGFAGTLDPIASGLLICGISKATTLLDWFHFFPKTYVAEMQLGSSSDTYDSEGAKTKVSDAVPSREEVAAVLESCKALVEQEPPMHSAKKVGGEKLYEVARRGETIERKKHPITIHALTLDAYEYPLIRFSVVCSSGTYVRSLVHTIGQELRVGGFMSALRRTAIGGYTVGQARAISAMTDVDRDAIRVSPEDLRERLNAYLRAAWA
jgi:tRNA pseudouridine55 synthase